MRFPQKMGLAGAIVAAIGIIFGWAIFPPLLKDQIGKAKALSLGSESRTFWERVPFSLDFKVYVFNITNANAVHEGEVPALQEIGPFYFDEWKSKEDIMDFEEDDSVSFHMRNVFVFNREKSAPLTGEEMITTVHPLLMGIVGATERRSPKLLKMINKAIPALFNGPESVFLRSTALDFLFHGTYINCTSKDFQVHAVCVVLQKQSSELIKTNVSGVFKHSILGAKNVSSDPNKFRVRRGVRDAQEVGKMIALNDKKKLAIWRGRPCNDLIGTDSTVFPPFLKEDFTLWVYSVEICRSLAATFQRRSVYKGINSLRYTVSLGDMSKDPSLKCFCPSEDVCMKKGALDLMPCTGAPIVASLPHFLDAAPDYRKTVRGINPDKTKHEIMFEMEPMTGTPLQAKKRLMFSMPIHKVNDVPLTAGLPTAIVPLLWVEEDLELNDDFVHKIDSDLFRVIRIVDTIKWLLMATGAAIAIIAVALHYKQMNSIVVTPTSSPNSRGDPLDREATEPKRVVSSRGFELDGGLTNFGFI